MARDRQPVDVEAAAAELYALAPEDFTACRTRLVRAARDAGDKDAAAAINRLRKPTLAAALVNRLALADDSVAGGLRDLGARLQAAQDALEPAALRTLSGERRDLVARLTARAVKGTRVSATVREDVSATLDAALADPSVTERLGRLTTAEHWSGFGGSATPAGPPALRLVRGQPAASRPKPAAPDRNRAPSDRRGRPPAADHRGRPPAADHRLDQARNRADEADRALAAADEAQRAAQDRVDQLAAAADEAQRQLAGARSEHHDAQREARVARRRARDAQQALDRLRGRRALSDDG